MGRRGYLHEQQLSTYRPWPDNAQPPGSSCMGQGPGTRHSIANNWGRGQRGDWVIIGRSHGPRLIIGSFPLRSIGGEGQGISRIEAVSRSGWVGSVRPWEDGGRWVVRALMS